MDRGPPARSTVVARARALGWACASVLPLAWLYRAWFQPGVMPRRGDPGIPGLWGDLVAGFGSSFQVVQRALLEDDVFPLWNRFSFAGEPLFAKPQAVVVSTATILGALLGYPDGLKADMLLKNLLLGTGLAALARTLGASRAMAAAAGALGLTSAFHVFHLHRGHLNFLNGLAWSAWLLVALARSLNPRAREPVRAAVLVGLLAALQFYDGADVTLAWGALACVAIAASGLVDTRTRGRVIPVVFGASTVALVLSLARLLPLLEYLQLSNRQDGVPWRVAAATAGEVIGEPALDPAAYALATLGVLLVPRRHRAVAWALGLVGLGGFIVAREHAVFRLLFEHVPMFDAQRIPARAELLLVLVVPPLAGAAQAGLRRYFPHHAGRVNTVMTSLAWCTVGWQLHLAHPAPPVVPVDEELNANVFMRQAAAHAGDERLALFENEGRHWAVEHVTVPLGIEGIVGPDATWMARYLSPQQYMPEAVAFLDNAVTHPARTWGLLSVGVAGSMVPRDLPGFTLLTTTPPCAPAVCMPRKSAGPYLYRNTQALPRAFHAARAFVFAGRGPLGERAHLELLRDDAWDPFRTVLLHAEGEPIERELLEHADLLVAHASMETARGRITVLQPTVDVVEPVRAAMRSLQEGTPPIVPLEMRRHGMEERACAPGAGWLVFSSKYALVPGWRALLEDGTTRRVHRANGAATAVHVDRAACVTLQYRPLSVYAGAAVSLAGLPVVVMLLLRRRRAA